MKWLSNIINSQSNFDSIFPADRKDLRKIIIVSAYLDFPFFKKFQKRILGNFEPCIKPELEVFCDFGANHHWISHKHRQDYQQICERFKHDFSKESDIKFVSHSGLLHTKCILKKKLMPTRLLLEKSLALSSILNEALNLHEATFPSKRNRDYFNALVDWGKHQDWNWNDIAIRFTWWPICETIKPFCFDGKDLVIKGREANNRIKHHGDMATFEDTLNACAAAWFFVLEKARETKVFIGESELQKMFKIFDCYDLIDSPNHGYGYMICRPIKNKVCYPAVRGQSEIEDAKQAFEQRMAKRSKNKKP